MRSLPHAQMSLIVPMPQASLGLESYDIFRAAPKLEEYYLKLFETVN